MANKKTVALTEEQYKKMIKLILEGFTWEGKVKVANKDEWIVKKIMVQPNRKIATALILEGNLGMRISDILKLRLCDIIRDGNRFRIDIYEQKTGKHRNFTVPLETYTYMQDYVISNGMTSQQRMIGLQERVIQKTIKMAAETLGYENIGTHSFRKFYATEIYKNSQNNLRLVQTLLQHSDVSVTQRYIGISEDEVEKALQGHIKLTFD